MNIKMKLHGAAAAIAVGALTPLGAALAHGGIDDKQPDLKTLVSESAMVVWGDVSDIAYVNSQPTEEEPNGVPHTFVTYKVRETMRGTAQSSVTLRFVGGADGRGGVYMETTTPVFMRGQSDILFIKGGAPDDCPLVACVDGRFRVANGGVHNGWGIPVVEARKGLVIGGRPDLSLLKMELPRPPFEALASRPEIKALIGRQFANMSMDEMRKRYEAEAPAQSVISYEVSSERGAEDQGVKSPPIRTFGKPMAIADFVGAVREAAAGAPPPRMQVQFADPKAPFTVAPPKPAIFKAAVAAPNISPEEKRELDLDKEGTTRPTLDPRKPTKAPRGIQDNNPVKTEDEGGNQ